jgi:hypothetical protein
MSDLPILFVTFAFTPSKKGSYEVVKTNMFTAGIYELVETYLHGIVGAGADKRDAEHRDVYTITLAIDLTDDTIKVKHDCGNLGLVAGILMTIFKDLPGE